MVARLTVTLRAAVAGYLTTDNADDKLLYFNKLVSICTANAARLFIPSRTVGFGKSGKKTVKDNLVKDLAEEFVLEELHTYPHPSQDVIGLIESGHFDYISHRFKQRVLNNIRDIKRSGEEAWVEELPIEENKSVDDE